MSQIASDAKIQSAMTKLGMTAPLTNMDDSQVLKAILVALGNVTGGGGGSGGTVTSVSFTGGLISVATATTTPALTVAGTSGGIPYFSSASTWASSGVLAANALLVGGGAGAAPASIPTGTGVVAALANTVNTASGVLTYDIIGTSGAKVPLLNTDNTWSAAQTNSTNGAASTPAWRLTGSVFTGGTATTTKPLALIEPTGTTSTGWKTSGTMLGVNAASAFVGNLLDLQLNGSSKLGVSYEGVLTVANGGGLTTQSGALVLGPSQFSGGAYITLTNFNVGFGNARTSFMDSSVYLSGGYQTQFANARADAADVGLVWGSAGHLKVTNGSTGVGTLQFGVHSAVVAEVVTGYITIKDGAGTTRKLAVIS